MLSTRWITRGTALSILVLLAGLQASRGLRLLENTLPPIPQDGSSSDAAPADSSSSSLDSGANPVAIRVDSPSDSSVQPGAQTGEASPAPPTDSTPDTAGAAFTSGNVPAQTPQPTASPAPPAQEDASAASSSSSVHLPNLPPADRSALLHSSNIPAVPRVSSLTDIVGPEGSARAGTFTPPGAGAALSCSIPELLGVQPGLQVTGGQSVLGAAVMGPLTGNSCPGDGATPFQGCPTGSYCPTPAQQALCPPGMFCPRRSAHPRKCPALAACPAGAAAPGFNAGAFITIVLVVLVYLAVFLTARHYLRRQSARRKQQQASRNQLRVLLNAQSRATEGFTFQGLEHVKDHAVVSLNDLTLAGPKAGQPALRGVSAKLQHYRLTLVVGPYDSDVSRLMRLLAGRAPAGSILSGSCQTTLGGSYLGCRSVIGYATSEAALFGDLTIRENLEYTCRMEQPVSTTAHQRHCIVGDVVRLLHLQEACDDMAGLLICGGSLSWRLSLAMALVSSPSLLIIDGVHPSTNASQELLFMEALQLLTSLGMTIVTTCLPRRAYEEQPPHVDLLLLGHEGATVYSGPLRLTTPYFLSIGLGSYGAGLTQESLRDIICSPDASVPFLDGQTLTQAWKDRMADPWTQKTLKEGPHPGVDNRLQPQQTAAFHVGPNMVPELPTLTAATLTALQEFTCHKSARHEITDKTEVAVHDIVALTHALDVPCSPEAASCILLNAHAACKLGQSSQLTKKDLAKHDTHRAETILNVEDALLRDSDKLLSQDGLSCKVSIAQLAAWLVQQDAKRRQHAQQAQRTQRIPPPLSSGHMDSAWEPSLPTVQTAPAAAGHKGPDVSSEAFEDLGGGLCITDVNPEDFASIDFRDKTLTPSGSQEQRERPKEASFMDRILRGGSGCLQSESMPPEPRPASRQSSRSRISLSCEAKLEDGPNHLGPDNTHLRDATEQPMPLRQRHWGPADAALGSCALSMGSTGTAGSRALPDAEAAEAGEQSYSGTPTAEPLKRSSSHRFFHSTTTAVRQAFQISRSKASNAETALAPYKSRRQPGVFHMFYFNMLRASQRWMRKSGTLLHSLVLCTAAACVLGLLCAASFDVSGIPAVHMRVVLVLYIACAPFALQPFAGARAILAQGDASCMHSLAFFCGTALLDLISVTARALVFAGVLTWMVPTYAGYDWHAVALILVSWYAAVAGYAASASFRPATAAALLLGGGLCALLLLSGAVAPTLRTMYSSGSLFYGLSALGLGRWSVELLTIAEYSGLDNALQHLGIFKLAQVGYCGLESIPLPGRMDSRDDIAVIVSNALNPLALQGTKFTSLANLVAAAQPQIGSKLADGLTCVLQTAVDGAGPNCIMQMCQQQVNQDVLALFMLGLALCLLTALGLMRVPRKLVAAVRRVHHQTVMALKKLDRKLSPSNSTPALAPASPSQRP